MPNEPFTIVIVNGDGSFDDLVKTWHPRLTVRHIRYDAGKRNGFYFTFMALPLPDLLKESCGPILYLDGDIVLRGKIDYIFKVLEQYDITFKYRPFLSVTGPLGSRKAARANSGVVGLSNNRKTRRFAAAFRAEMLDFAESDKDPIGWNDELTAFTGIDQELLWEIVERHSKELRFFPLDERYNDSSFRFGSAIWHAKGVARNSPYYMLQCRRYGFKRSSGLRIFGGIIESFLRRQLKSMLTPVDSSYSIEQLSSVLDIVKPTAICILSSEFVRQNKILQARSNIVCYDVDPRVYFDNEALLSRLGIEHRFLVHDYQIIPKETYDLVLHEKKWSSLIRDIEYGASLVREH